MMRNQTYFKCVAVALSLGMGINQEPFRFWFFLTIQILFKKYLENRKKKSLKIKSLKHNITLYLFLGIGIHWLRCMFVILSKKLACKNHSLKTKNLLVVLCVCDSLNELAHKNHSLKNQTFLVVMLYVRDITKKNQLIKTISLGFRFHWLGCMFLIF